IGVEYVAAHIHPHAAGEFHADPGTAAEVLEGRELAHDPVALVVGDLARRGAGTGIALDRLVAAERVTEDPATSQAEVVALFVTAEVHVHVHRASTGTTQHAARARHDLA